MLPPETIEAIVLHVIFSKDTRVLRCATFNSLVLLSCDWSFQARRLELLRIELRGSSQLDRLIQHLITLKERHSCPRRAPTQHLTVDLSESQHPEQINRVAELLDLLDLRRLRNLTIKTPFDRRYEGTGLHLLQPGGRTLPQLESLTATHLSGQSISSLILACDPTRLKMLDFNTTEQWIVEQNLRWPTGATVMTFPKLTSLAANFYGGFCGGPGTEGTPVVPNLERLALNSSMRPWEWRGVAERLKKYHPPRLAHLQVHIEKSDLDFDRDVRMTAIQLAREMGWTVSIIMTAQYLPVEQFAFTPGSETSAA